MDGPEIYTFPHQGLEGVHTKKILIESGPKTTELPMEDEFLGVPDCKSTTDGKMVLSYPPETSGTEETIHMHKVVPDPVGSPSDFAESDPGITKALLLKSTPQKILKLRCIAPKDQKTIEEAINIVNNRSGHVEMILDPTMMSGFENLKIGLELGSGACGSVTGCFDPHTQKKLVKKTISQTGRIKEFLPRNEIMIPAVLRHDSLTRVVGFRCDMTTIDVVQEYAGESLAREYNRLHVKFKHDEFALLDFVTQLFKALAWLERHGMSHCDLKPENICVNGQRLKLVDLGSAVTQQDAHACVGNATPEYLPPGICSSLFKEGVLKAQLFFNEHADTWSAGLVTQYILMGGVHPMIHYFTKKTTFSPDQEERCIVIKKIAQLCDPTPLELTTCYSHATTTLLKGVLSRHVEDRWSAQQAITFLEKHTSRLMNPHVPKQPKVVLYCEPETLVQPKVVPAAQQMNTGAVPATPREMAYGVQPPNSFLKGPVFNPGKTMDSIFHKGSQKADCFEDCEQDDVDEDEVMALMGDRFSRQAQVEIKHQGAARLGVVFKKQDFNLNVVKTRMVKTDNTEARTPEFKLHAGNKVVYEDDARCESEQPKIGTKRSHCQSEYLPNFDLLQDDERQWAVTEKAKINPKLDQSNQKLRESKHLFEVVVKPKADVSEFQSNCPDLDILMDGMDADCNQTTATSGKLRRKIKAHRSSKSMPPSPQSPY